MTTRNECAVSPHLLLAPGSLFGRCRLLPLWRCAGGFQPGSFFGQPGRGAGFGLVGMDPARHAMVARCAEAPQDDDALIVAFDAFASRCEKGLGESAGEILLVHPVAVDLLSFFFSFGQITRESSFLVWKGPAMPRCFLTQVALPGASSLHALHGLCHGGWPTSTEHPHHHKS